MKIAIIGSGIAGLTAAWLFQRAGHDITLYERQTKIGLDAHTVELEVDGVVGRVDVPLRGFNPENWPNLMGLCQAVGVDTEAVDLSHSFNRATGETIFSYHNVEVEQPYTSLIKNQRVLNRTALQILSEVFRFKYCTKEDMSQPHYADLTLKEYLEARDYAASFVYDYMYPALTTICTCSYDSLDAYPVAVIVNFLENLLGKFNIRRLTGGSQAIVQRLSQDINQICYNTSIKKVYPHQKGVQLETALGTTDDYEQVIIATQANQAWRLLGQPSPEELTTLQAFPYDAVSVSIHCDPGLMPHNRADWGMINFTTRKTHEAAMSTIWMNRLEAVWQGKTPVFQTVGPIVEPKPAMEFQRIEFERAVVNHASRRALAQLDQLHQQPDRRIWFCGSYASPGIPLLESGVCSSVKVATLLGVPCPWGTTL